MYLAKMYQCLTCGFETTLLILAHMFKIPILVIRQDFVWISSKVAPIMCPVVLVQDETGFFLGMCTPNPIYVGSVPVVTVPYSIMNEDLFTTSTPSHTSNRPTNTVFSCGLSPINSDNTTTDTNISVENKRRKKMSNTKSKKTKESGRKSQPIMTAVRNQEMNKDLGTDTSTTSQEMKALREKIKKFEEKTPESQLSTTIDPNEEKNVDDLSTTIDPNEDDGQRTDIGFDHLSFSADKTLLMSKETDNDKSCTEMYSTTNDESQTEVTKAVKASNEVAFKVDISGNTETKNDMRQNPMDNLPTEEENIQREKGDESKNSDVMSAPLFTELTEEMSIQSKNSDMEEHTLKLKKRRLGMTGPAFMKLTLSVNISDVSKELEIPKEQNVVETCISARKQVVQKYMCKKCPEMFFTKNRYERHLMCNHKIWNVDQYQPEIIEKNNSAFWPRWI